MNCLEVLSPQVHDLLQIGRPSLSAGRATEPSWVRRTLLDCPWVVVRGAQAAPGLIAVGVRGDNRSERWAAFCEKSLVSKIVRPEELLFSKRASKDILRTPALRALQELRERWADVTLPWGPAGSVGFELASGRKVTTKASDLDLVIRARERIAVEEAQFLVDCTIGLEAKVDVRVETPVCGFSFEEYVLAPSARILLRYPDGVRLGEDPWLTPNHCQEEA
jgi:phosphoribosyl-dephospho-CoA transferase